MGLPPGFGDCQPGDINSCIPDPPPILPPSGGISISGAAIFQAIAAFASAVTSAIASILSLLKAAFGALKKFLLHLWQEYVKKAIAWLAQEARKVRDWLKRTIAPIIKRLEKIKKWYDEHVLKQQLRLYQQIQTIRRILAILRLFHVKWAAKLDGALADIQQRIEVSIAVVRGTLNQIINTLAIAFDPSLLIRSNVLGASLLSNLGAVKRIFGFGDNRILSASEQATIDKQHALYFKATVDSHISTVVSTGLTPDDKAQRTDFRKALEEARGAPLPI